MQEALGWTTLRLPIQMDMTSIEFARRFWSIVESRGSINGTRILELDRYGLASRDRIEFALNAVDGLPRTIQIEIAALWRVYCQKTGVNYDIILSSMEAVEAGYLKTERRHRAPRGRPAILFWTIGNEAYRRRYASLDNTEPEDAELLDSSTENLEPWWAGIDATICKHEVQIGNCDAICECGHGCLHHGLGEDVQCYQDGCVCDEWVERLG